MRKVFVISALFVMTLGAVSFTGLQQESANLRRVYMQDPSRWPAPDISPGVAWNELGPLPPGPLAAYADSLKPIIELGKILFFDNRLSGSGKISCGTCHQPALSWTDGRMQSIGHEGTINRRNAPSIQNSWYYKRLFWDGRSSSLEDQAFAPINSESEMHNDIRELPGQLRKIAGYPPLFNAAFGDPGINPDRIGEALAVFQRTITSAPAAFDRFLKGEKMALSGSALRGLHLFRTKARCMNCHHGPLLSDNQFHNNGFSGKDVGLYHVTHAEGDIGKMKTPSLRDVLTTGPWMHDGKEKRLDAIIGGYNAGQGQKSDTLLKPLGLSKRELKDLLSFLASVSADPIAFSIPEMPK